MKGHSIVGTSTTRERVAHDYYATDPISTLSLLERESFEGTILEPCCGEGHISKILESHGYTVRSNDLINRGYGDTFKNFLTEDFEFVDNVVTNPPFKHAQEFIEKALSITDKKVAIFCKLQFLESTARKEFFESTPLKTVYVFSKRQRVFRNGQEHENGKRLSSTIAFAWFVWEHGYEGEPVIKWI